MGLVAVCMTKWGGSRLHRMMLSLDAQGEPYRGVLVDTGSGGGAALATSMGWEAHLSPTSTFSAGNNLAASLAVSDGDELLLVNDDAVLLPWAVRSMRAHLSKDRMVGSLILSSDGRVNHSGVAFGEDGTPLHTGRGQDLRKWYGDCTYAWAVTFATVLIPGELWRRLDGLDEGYAWGFEDTDFCMRVWEVGGEVVVCRESLVIHDEFGTRVPGEDDDNRLRFKRRWVYEGRAYTISSGPADVGLAPEHR